MDLLLDLQLKIKLHQFTTKEHLLILWMMIHGIKELKIPFSDFLSSLAPKSVISSLVLL